MTLTIELSLPYCLFHKRYKSIFLEVQSMIRILLYQALVEI
jgi:hypothetical protein